MKNLSYAGMIRCVGAALWLVAAAPGWAAVLMYDASQGTLPAAQGWTNTGSGPGPGSTESVANGTLSVTDASEFTRFQYMEDATVNPQTTWQARAQVRVLPDYSGSSGIANGSIFNQLVGDEGGGGPGAGAFGYGLTTTSP